MKNVSYQQVDITGGFWKEKQDINRKITMQSIWDRFQDTGRIGAFACQWQEGMEHKPHVFWDSDVAKWIEAAAYLLQKEDDPELRRKIDGIVEQIAKNRREDGYYNSYYNVCDKDQHFVRRENHELYCLGHLTEAAVAYYQATGKDRMLQLVKDYLHLVEEIFIKQNSAAFVTPGHEEIELALFRLYHCTGEEKYRDMAAFFLNQRGNNPKDRPVYGESNVYIQANAPIRQLHSAGGHAVRALYLYSAMADLAHETGDAALAQACATLFEDVTQRKMYITGGCGSTHHGEAFTIPYDLPNSTAYAETCAAIGLIFFCQRMLQMEGKSVYADIVERCLYNGFLSGISLDGKSFFYENPLEICLQDHIRHHDLKGQERLPITQRKEVFDCSCCPPNIARLLASVGGYLYGVEGRAVYVHQFAQSVFSQDGMTLRQSTCYPADGHILLDAQGIERLYVRIPGWCREFTLNVPYTMEKGYARIDRPTGEISLSLSMEPTLIEANPKIRADVGRAAVQAGPLVYCAEGKDNPLPPQRYCISRRLRPQSRFDPQLGVTIWEVDACYQEDTKELYAPFSDEWKPARLSMIPYYCFANRGESDMLVWLPVK